MYKVIQGKAERMTNFKMAIIQHQGEEHMSGRYNFGRMVLTYFLHNVLFYFTQSHGAVDDRISCVYLWLLHEE